MAKEKKEKKAKAAVAPAVEEKKAKTTKKVLTPEEKKAKRAKRAEALKNRPAGQRPNSKQIDVIETEKGTVKTYGYAVKGKGVMVTTVALNEEGAPVSASTSFVPGPFAIKTKKGHGYIKFVKGIKDEDIEVEENDDNEPEDEDED